MLSAGLGALAGDSFLLIRPPLDRRFNFEAAVAAHH